MTRTERVALIGAELSAAGFQLLAERDRREFALEFFAQLKRATNTSMRLHRAPAKEERPVVHALRDRVYPELAPNEDPVLNPYPILKQRATASIGVGEPQ